LFFCMRFEEQINYFKNENSYLIHEWNQIYFSDFVYSSEIYFI
jgi:hypothetical protein